MSPNPPSPVPASTKRAASPAQTLPAAAKRQKAVTEEADAPAEDAQSAAPDAAPPAAVEEDKATDPLTTCKEVIIETDLETIRCKRLMDPEELSEEAQFPKGGKKEEEGDADGEKAAEASSSPVPHLVFEKQLRSGMHNLDYLYLSTDGAYREWSAYKYLQEEKGREGEGELYTELLGVFDAGHWFALLFRKVGKELPEEEVKKLDVLPAVNRLHALGVAHQQLYYSNHVVENSQGGVAFVDFREAVLLDKVSEEEANKAREADLQAVKKLK
ncbi:hypothetical protein JCM10450v2_008057 [Rhodotorula kratochvilovae]